MYIQNEGVEVGNMVVRIQSKDHKINIVLSILLHPKGPQHISKWALNRKIFEQIASVLKLHSKLSSKLQLEITWTAY